MANGNLPVLRTARDYERDPGYSEALIPWAAINTITRRLAAVSRQPTRATTLTSAT